MPLSAAINMGWVYEASWGPGNAREVAARLASEEDLGPEDIPTAYRYAVVDEAGEVRETDLEGARLDRARQAAEAVLGTAPGTVEITGGGSGFTYATFPLEGGDACTLVSKYLPQWASRDLAEALPNPQNFMLVAGAVGSAVALALVAHRASRVISRKMAPLAEAAARVGNGELDFAVGRTNVREMNDVLDAMDAMRTSLASSLEARWAAERSQREQVASLAHDLKTPLTVLRANADFVAGELGGEETPGTACRTELAAAARDIAEGADRLDGYVHLLIDASRGAGEVAKAPVQPAELCRQVIAEAGPVARAAANLVANAAEHARSRVELTCAVANETLVIEIADDGPGFSPAALAHGCERLFTDDSARSARDGERHYGLGLYAAAEAARAHGGSVTLANRTDAGGTVLGAAATIAIPLQGQNERN